MSSINLLSSMSSIKPAKPANQKKDTCKKYSKPIYISIKARLRQPTYANFLEYYHKGSADNDHFYKYLVKLSTEHKLFMKDAESFKLSFTQEGFYFKTLDIVKCKNAIGKPCLLEDLLDRDVVFKLKILPYDFLTPEGKQIIGISITCLEANGKPSID